MLIAFLDAGGTNTRIPKNVWGNNNMLPPDMRTSSSPPPPPPGAYRFQFSDLIAALFSLFIAFVSLSFPVSFPAIETVEKPAREYVKFVVTEVVNVKV